MLTNTCFEKNPLSLCIAEPSFSTKQQNNNCLTKFLLVICFFIRDIFSHVTIPAAQKKLGHQLHQLLEIFLVCQQYYVKPENHSIKKSPDITRGSYNLQRNYFLNLVNVVLLPPKIAPFTPPLTQNNSLPWKLKSPY